MQPDDDGAVEAPPGLLRPLLELVHSPARVQAHSEAVRPLDLEAVEAGGGYTRGRVLRGEEPRRQVRASVAREIRWDGQGTQVHGVAALHLQREWRAVEDDGLERLLQSLGVLLREVRLAHTER